MQIINSMIVGTSHLADGAVTNVKVLATAGIDATKLDLSQAELQAAETAGTSIILKLFQQALLGGR